MMQPLNGLPLAWRCLLTCVLLLIGGGYAAALLNVYAQNELTDGKPGLGPRDLTLKYSGDWVETRAGEAAPSRMLQMIQGSMREYFVSDEHYERMLGFLKAGAAEAEFGAGREPTPQDVLVSDCLRCHAADSGKEIGTQAPFGPDAFTTDYRSVAKFAAVASPGTTTAWRPPRDWRALALTTHAHMLSVPIFVVLLAGLFLCAGWPRGESRGAAALRALLACAPLALFLIDVACWWLARLPGFGRGFALVIGVSGGLFGLFFAIQWVVVIRALWKRRAGT